MSLISKDFIDRLDEYPLEDLLERRGVRLPKRTNNNGNVLIPCVSHAHDDHNPSLSVNIKTQQFFCHGCGIQGGGALQLFAEMEGIDPSHKFRDLVHKLADIAGYQVEYKNDNSPTTGSSRKAIMEALLKTTEAALEPPYFEDDRIAVAKFIQERGITSNDRSIAKMGFIPRNFHTSPVAKRYEEPLIAAGVLGKAENGRLFCNLGGRIIFPIADARGNVIALAGRKLSDDQPGAKYKNTAESEIFKKSRVLYGLHNVVKGLPPEETLDRIVVVEGYMDVTTAHARGFTDHVASMGTAFTEHHIRLLRRHTNTVVFSFDPDEAGRTAAKRALMSALPFAGDMDFKFVEMPEVAGKKYDADAFLKEFSPAAYESVISSGISLAEMAVKYVLGDKGVTNLQEMLAEGIDRRAMDVFSSFHPGPARELFMLQLAADIGRQMDLSLMPEHLGIRLNYEMELASATEQMQNALMEAQSLHTQATSAEAEAAMLREQVATLEKQLSDSRLMARMNSTQPHTTSEQIAAPENPSTKINEPPPQEAQRNTRTIQNDKFHSSPASQQAEFKAGPGVRKTEETSTKPLSLSYVKTQAPQVGHWVLLPGGSIGNVQAVNGDILRCLAPSGIEMEPEDCSHAIVLNPAKIITSKFDGPHHHKGDKLLLLGSEWVSCLPSEHYDLTMEVVTNPVAAASNRPLLERLAKAALTTEEISPGNLAESLKLINSCSLNQLMDKIGLTESISALINPAKLHEPYAGRKEQTITKMPDGLLIKAAVRAGDYVTSQAMNGAIQIIVDNGNGSLHISDPVAGTNSELKSAGTLLVIKPVARTLSSVKSSIAEVGQPIIKATKEGAWISRVPLEWILEKEAALGKQQSPSDSPSP